MLYKLYFNLDSIILKRFGSFSSFLKIFIQLIIYNTTIKIITRVSHMSFTTLASMYVTF